MPAGINDKFTKSYSFLQKSLGATISDSANSLTLNNYTNVPTDTKVHFIIDRIDSNGNRTNSARELCSGICNGSGVSNVTRGLHGTTAQSHDAGAVVEFVLSGAAWNDLIDGLLAEHNQDGTHSDITADSVTVTDLTVNGDLTIAGVASDGWTATGGTHSVATGYNSGNRSFEIDTSTDLSGIVSPGMRYKVTRDTTPPTQCADLEASSSHYASKSSPAGTAVTTTISVEGWIKPESYGTGAVISHYSSYGWILYLNSSGQVVLLGDDAAGTADTVTSHQSVPLNRWTHIAATLTLNSAGKILIDGVEVPIDYSNGTCTTIQENGNLELGSYGGSNFFDGKLADVRVWSDIRTATEIRDNMYAYPSDTTGLVAHFKLNGDFTDASSNSNDLTAQNSAVATNADNPWNATEYGIITAVDSNSIQVFCPEGYGIPNETLSSPFYSTQSAPFGFPRDRGKWVVETVGKFTQTDASPSTSFEDRNIDIAVPVGAWELGYSIVAALDGNSTSLRRHVVTLSSSGSTETHPLLTSVVDMDNESGTAFYQETLTAKDNVTLSAQTVFSIISKVNDTGGVSNLYINLTSDTTDRVTAECAYL